MHGKILIDDSFITRSSFIVNRSSFNMISYELMQRVIRGIGLVLLSLTLM